MVNDKSKVNTLINLIKVSCPYYPLDIHELKTEIEKLNEKFTNFESQNARNFKILGSILVFMIIAVLGFIIRKCKKSSNEKCSSTNDEKPKVPQISLNDLKAKKFYAVYEELNYRSCNKLKDRDFYGDSVTSSVNNVDECELNSDRVSYSVI
jgi:hypothetical protein